jgi:hypothetical protein
MARAAVDLTMQREMGRDQNMKVARKTIAHPSVAKMERSKHVFRSS